MNRPCFLTVGFLCIAMASMSLSSVSAQRPQRGGDSGGRDSAQDDSGGGDSSRGGRDGGRDGARGRDGGGGFRGGPGAGGGMFGGPGGGDSEIGLLRSEEVRQELELMPDQEDAIGAIGKRSESTDRGGFDPRQFDFRNASEEERIEMFKKMQAARKEQASKQREQLGKILLPEQMGRLQQINLQTQGIAALAETDVQKQLGITETQTEKLQQIRSDQETKMRDSMREMWQSGDRDGIREKAMKMRDEVETLVLKELTPAQKQKWDEMKGKPFDLTVLRRPDAGRGPAGSGRGPSGDRNRRPDSDR